MFKAVASYQSGFNSDSISDIFVHQNLATFSSTVPDIKLLSFPDLKFLGTLKGHSKFTTKMNFFNDGKLLMSCSEDGTSIIWDLTSMKIVSTLNAGIGELSSMDLIENKFALGGETDIIVGDLRKFTQPTHRIKDMHCDIVRQVNFIGNNLISASDDGCINQYDLSTTNEDDLLIDVLNIGNGIRKFGFCNDSIVHVLTQTHSLSLWNIKNNKEIISIDRNQLSCDYLFYSDFSMNQINLYGGFESGDFFLISLNEELKQKDSIKFMNGHSDYVECAWTNSNVFLSGADDGKLILWKQTKGDIQKESNLKEMKMKDISKFRPY
eukprot:gene1603-12728_t